MRERGGAREGVCGRGGYGRGCMRERGVRERVYAGEGVQEKGYAEGGVREMAASGDGGGAGEGVCGRAGCGVRAARESVWKGCVR